MPIGNQNQGCVPKPVPSDASGRLDESADLIVGQVLPAAERRVRQASWRTIRVSVGHWTNFSHDRPERHGSILGNSLQFDNHHTYRTTTPRFRRESRSFKSERAEPGLVGCCHTADPGIDNAADPGDSRRKGDAGQRPGRPLRRRDAGFGPGCKAPCRAFAQLRAVLANDDELSDSHRTSKRSEVLALTLSSKRSRCS